MLKKRPVALCRRFKSASSSWLTSAASSRMTATVGWRNWLNTAEPAASAIEAKSPSLRRNCAGGSPGGGAGPRSILRSATRSRWNAIATGSALGSVLRAGARGRGAAARPSRHFEGA